MAAVVSSLSYVPSALSLNSLLLVLCRRNQGLKLVPCVLMKSRVLNIRLEESSFEILISGDFGVLSFLESIRKVGFCPGMIDYAKVINVLVKEKRGLDALDVLNQIKAARMKPDIVCYTMVLNGVIMEGEYDKADELFDELLVLGLVPDVYTYNVYINGLCKQNNVKGGLDVLLLCGGMVKSEV
ncbi:hypothetical protein G4B88_029629 [Cannabis sativa]|uniref:Pentatricopeptide repeat-containing protein n=1 Tax=Cannabis sativa TaxID=3483 RepID=A0A7J6FVF9_CANSA|nr:hypothetical protein G4B88_029629 [Cannabis sativa]